MLFIAPFGFLIGSLSYVFGAVYTMIGVVWIVNQVLAFLGVPDLISEPTWSNSFHYLFFIPFFISFIEWNRKKAWEKGYETMAIWVIVSVFDLITNLIGIQQSNPENMPRILAWITSFVVGQGILAMILTLTPEWLIRASFAILYDECVELLTKLRIRR
jgi:hypothetical protein